MPIAALGCDPEEYIRRLGTLNKSKAELRRNTEVMDRCMQEITTSMNAGIEFLTQYRDFWVQSVLAEKTHMVEIVEKAIQAAEKSLLQGGLQCSPLAQALFVLPARDFLVFQYSITPPDLQSGCQTWLSYTNTLSSLSDRYQCAVLKSSQSLLVSSSQDPVNVLRGSGTISLSRSTQQFLEITEAMKVDFHRNSEEIFEQSQEEVAKTIGRHRLPIEVLVREIKGNSEQFQRLIQPYAVWRRSKKDGSFYRCLGVMLLENYCRPSTSLQDFEAFYRSFYQQNEQFAVSSDDIPSLQHRKIFTTLQNALIKARKRGENALQLLQYYLQRTDIDKAVVMTIQTCISTYMQLQGRKESLVLPVPEKVETVCAAHCFAVGLRIVWVESQGVLETVVGLETPRPCFAMVWRDGSFHYLVRREVHEADGYDFAANAYNPGKRDRVMGW